MLMFTGCATWIKFLLQSNEIN